MNNSLYELRSNLNDEIKKLNIKGEYIRFLMKESDGSKDMKSPITTSVENVNLEFKDEWLQRVKDALNWVRNINFPTKDYKILRLDEEKTSDKYIEIRYCGEKYKGYYSRDRYISYDCVINGFNPLDQPRNDNERAIRYELFQHALIHGASLVKRHLDNESKCVIL